MNVRLTRWSFYRMVCQIREKKVTCNDYFRLFFCLHALEMDPIKEYYFKGIAFRLFVVES
jgi:hypothetical protein